MSSLITPVAGRIQVTASPTDARAAKVHQAAAEFESMLVKQLLKQAKIAGDDKANGYGDMAVDALASAVEKGGGLGLARRIEEAMRPVLGPSCTKESPKG